MITPSASWYINLLHKAANQPADEYSFIGLCYVPCGKKGGGVSGFIRHRSVALHAVVGGRSVAFDVSHAAKGASTASPQPILVHLIRSLGSRVMLAVNWLSKSLSAMAAHMPQYKTVSSTGFLYGLG